MRSPEVKIGQIFANFQESGHAAKHHPVAQELWKVKTICKKRIDSSWNALSLMCPQIWPQVNSLGSRGHQRSMTFITPKKFLAYISETKRDTSFLRTLSSSSRRDASNEVWHDLERSSSRLTSGQGQVKVKEGHVAYHMTRLDETNIMVLFVFR